MKRFNLLVITIFGLLTAGAQPAYDTLSIPNSLKENANFIKRFEQIRFDVKDIDRAVYSVHRVYTVLNEKGASQLFFAEYATRYRKIDEFEVRGFDSNGKEIERFKKKDLHRQAVLDGLVSDGSYYYIRLRAAKYPATIEYKYEIDLTGTAWYPKYEMQVTGESVQSSTFTATVPSDLDLRFKAVNTGIEPVISSDGKWKKYEWALRNSPAIVAEESQVEGVTLEPAIMLAPNKFRLYNTYGDMSSWNEFGKWGYELLQGLDDLPEDRRVFFANLVKDAKTDREKTAIIYHYLQKNFRYVSIQLGIGGWKPFPAAFTDEKKYGDCKGLSFFMYSVLKSLGIKSYCALIRSDYKQGGAEISFPHSQFNHMILCVPDKTDTTWLECTSNTAEFGMLGSSTLDRNALLLTEKGGVLVATPSGCAANNVLESFTEVWLDESGSGKSITRFNTKGYFREYALTMLNANPDDQKEMIVKQFGFIQPDEFQIEKKSHSNFLNFDLAMLLDKVPQFTAGSKMFLNQRLSPLWRTRLPTVSKRQQDYYFHHPLSIADTTVYHLPEGYLTETIPQKTSGQCSYADYEMESRFDAQKREIVTIARLQLHKNRVPAEKYNEVKAFFDKLLADENQKMIVKKN